MKKKEAAARRMEEKDVGAAEKTAELLRLCHRMTANSPLPIAAVERERHLARYVNSAFCRLAGKTKEELIGKSFAEAVPEGERAACLALLERVYGVGTGASLAYQEHSSSDSPPLCWSYAIWAVFTAAARAAGV